MEYSLILIPVLASNIEFPILRNKLLKTHLSVSFNEKVVMLKTTNVLKNSYINCKEL